MLFPASASHIAALAPSLTPPKLVKSSLRAQPGNQPLPASTYSNFFRLPLHPPHHHHLLDSARRKSTLRGLDKLFLLSVRLHSACPIDRKYFKLQTDNRPHRQMMLSLRRFLAVCAIFLLLWLPTSNCTIRFFSPLIERQPIVSNMGSKSNIVWKRVNFIGHDDGIRLPWLTDPMDLGIRFGKRHDPFDFGIRFGKRQEGAVYEHHDGIDPLGHNEY